MRRLLSLLILSLLLAALPATSHAQAILAGQPCGAPGTTAIATNGQPVVCTGNPLVWTNPNGGGSGGGLTVSTFAAIPTTCTPGTSPLLNVTTVPVGIYYCDGTNHYTNAGLSGSATIRLTDFGVVADTKANADCTWTASQNPVTVTCSGANDWTYTTADTGKVCVGPFSPSVSVGVFTYISATSGSCNAGVNSIGTGPYFIVYTDNATNTLAAWNTLISFPRCGTLLLPDGVWANSAPLVGAKDCTLGPSPSESGGLTVRPANGSSYTSIMFQPPNFNFSNCQVTNHGCMFAISTNHQQQLEDFEITGFNLSMSGIPCGSGVNTEIYGDTNVRARNLSLIYGFNNCSNNFAAFVLSGAAQTSTIYGFSQFDGFGTGTIVQEGAQNVLISDLFIGDCGAACTAMSITGSVVSHNTQYYGSSNGPGIILNTGAIFESYGDTIGGGNSVAAIDLGSGTTSFAYLNGDYLTCTGTPTQCITFRGAAGTGPTLSLQNTVLTQTSGATLTSSTAGDGFVIDYGGNNLASATTGTNGFTGSWKVTGPPVFIGKGTGVCTSSVTVFLFPIGQNSARTCTVVAESLLTGQGITNQAGTLHNLRCSATAAGSAAGSGIMTVRLNGVNTSITATFGTTTFANDSIHTQAVVAGDEITIQGVMAAAETLANPACQVQVN